MCHNTERRPAAAGNNSSSRRACFPQQPCSTVTAACVRVSVSSVIYSFVWVNVPFGPGVEPLTALQAARNRCTHYYCAVCLVVAAFWSVYPDVSLVLNTHSLIPL